MENNNYGWIIQLVTGAITGVVTYMVARVKSKPEMKENSTDHTEVLFNQYITTIQSLNNRIGMLEEKINRLEREKEEEIRAYKELIDSLEKQERDLEEQVEINERAMRVMSDTIERLTSENSDLSGIKELLEQQIEKISKIIKLRIY